MSPQGISLHIVLSHIIFLHPIVHVSAAVRLDSSYCSCPSCSQAGFRNGISSLELLSCNSDDHYYPLQSLLEQLLKNLHDLMIQINLETKFQHLKIHISSDTGRNIKYKYWLLNFWLHDGPVSVIFPVVVVVFLSTPHLWYLNIAFVHAHIELYISRK